MFCMESWILREVKRENLQSFSCYNASTNPLSTIVSKVVVPRELSIIRYVDGDGCYHSCRSSFLRLDADSRTCCKIIDPSSPILLCLMNV